MKTRASPSNCPEEPLPNYGLPTRIAPRWYVGYLTFQMGNPRLRAESLVGSGIINPIAFTGTFKPVMQPYLTRTQSLVGSGVLVGDELSQLNLLPQPSRRPGGVG